MFLIPAALHVSRNEQWRRSLVWRHVQYFASLTKLDITSPIISIVVGSEEAALRAGRFSLPSVFNLVVASSYFIFLMNFI
jgi:8-amino-7-oxononanoate synthase